MLSRKSGCPIGSHGEERGATMVRRNSTKEAGREVKRVMMKGG